jgi:hypothetical protein
MTLVMMMVVVVVKVSTTICAMNKRKCVDPDFVICYLLLLHIFTHYSYGLTFQAKVFVQSLKQKTEVKVGVCKK